MGESTKIQWCDHTFNPWRGCTKVAPGCANCYADAQAARNPGILGAWGPRGTRVVASESMWGQPLKWNKEAGKRGERHRVFCGSMCDVCEDWRGEIIGSDGKTRYQFTEPVSFPPVTMDDLRARLFALIDETPNLDWLLLTKRPENVRRMWAAQYMQRDADQGPYHNFTGGAPRRVDQVRENVWLGTSIACQEDADKNIPELLKCRDLAAKLFLSIEPLIGPVMLHHWIDEQGLFHHSQGVDVDWVIVGGESGPNARPCNVEWVRSVVEQCNGVGVPCFVKQLGSQPIEPDGSGFVRHVMLRDKKGGDPDEWTADLRVREFPDRDGDA